MFPLVCTHPSLRWECEVKKFEIGIRPYGTATLTALVLTE